MLKYFEENKLKLNLDKSYGKHIDIKNSLYLENGLLKYKSEIVYLGLIFSDIGKIGNDIKKNIQSKRSNVTVKYTNFCAENYLAPLKSNSPFFTRVLSSLCYGTRFSFYKNGVFSFQHGYS